MRSIVLQWYVDIGDYGRHSDGGVLSHSNFGQAMESGSLSIPEPANLPGTTTTLPYIFVGDAAFPLKTYVIGSEKTCHVDKKKVILFMIIIEHLLIYRIHLFYFI